MKRFLLSILFFVGFLSVGIGQDIYYSVVAGGNWNDPNTWDIDPPDGNGGDGVPGGTDIAVIQGDNAGGGNVLLDANATVGDVYIQYDNPNVLSKGGSPLGTYTLTINGQLGGFDIYTSFNFESPTTNVIQNNNSRLRLEFTAANSINPVIFNWSHDSPLRIVNFNSSSSGMQIEDLAIVSGGQINVTNGNLIINSGFELIDPSNNASITINSGSSLTVNGGINGDGTNSTRFNSVTINGTATTGTSGYINSNNFTLGDGSTLNINFNGTGQDEGWWYGTAAPAVFNLDDNSNINFTANTTQNIFAISSGYGNLNVNASSTVNKTLTGFGNLVVNGDLNIQSGAVTFTSTNTNPITLQGNVSNNGNWTTSQQVNFTGTNNQVINGSNPITFGEEVRIDKSSGNVTLQLVDQTINADLRILQGTFIPLARTVTLSGNIINDGTIEATQNGTGGFIFDGTTEISGTGTTQFRNITINNGASLTQEVGGEFEVTTNFTNNGTFTHNDGSVRFRQSGTKSISGSATTTFYDLSVEDGTVNVNGTVDLENVMTFVGSPAVDFDGGGSGVFTLKSTATRDAAIANVGSATFSGNLNVERYLSREGFNDYHIVSFPVEGATVADLQNDIPINGSFTGASGYTDGTFNSTNPSIYRYIENLGGGISARYSAWPTTDNQVQFTVGEGYHVFTYDGYLPISVTGNGTLKTGNFSRALSYTGSDPDAGWHAIANPYPAPSDWSQWSRGDINGGTAHLYDPQTGNYIPLDGSSQQLIPQGQGFFVKVDAAGTISATESSKVTGSTPSFYRNSDAPLQRFEIILRRDTIEDVAIVSFNENATDNYEYAYDADRLMNSNETLSTLTKDNIAVKVNRLATIENANECGRSIFLRLEQMVTGRDYELDFKDLENINSQSFRLVDHFLNEELEVASNTPYSFQVTSDPTSKGSTRFELVFSSKTPRSVTVNSEDICPSENAVINIQQSDDFANYLVYQGEEVVASAEGTGAELSIEVLNEFLVNSSNSFEIKAFAAGCDTVNVGNASIQVFETLTVNNSVEGSSICKSENQALFSVATQINASYFILNGADTIQSFEGNGNVYEGLIESAELEDGLNQFIIAARKDGCQNGTLTQTLEIEVQNPIIDESVTFSSTNTCYKTPTDITFSSQSGVEYQIFKGTTLVHTITGDGNEQTVEITEADLSLGLNEFTVSAQYGECAQYEFPVPIQIEVEENINTNLSLLTENTCGGENTSIVIENAQIGKIYTLQSAGENISSLTAQAAGELVFNLNTNQVNQGLNEFDIQIEGDICDTKLSTNQAVFTVYEPINSNLEYLAADICNATEASVGITNAQEGKTYKLYNSETLIESITASSDGELIFTNANNELVEGVNTFNLKIEGEGCGEVDVEQNLSITLFESINPNLDIISPDVCSGDQVNIEITNPQVGKTYNLMASENILATEIAENENVLSFSLPSNNFGIGYHALTVDIIDDNCGTLTANQTVEFELFDSAVIAEIENQDVCRDETVDIDLFANVAMGSYQLYVGDELISEVTNSTLTLAPLETTTYTLTGIPENGCSANTVNFTVEVTDLATPGILVSNNVLESSVEGDSYQWYINGEILEGETGKVLVAQESGDYTVQVNRANCTKISDAYSFSEEVLSANKALANAINLYPNPVVDVLNLDMKNISEIEITIYTLSGKFMDKMSVDSKSKPSIDMSKFSEGTYLIQLTSGKGSITKRIIKK